MRDVLKAGAVLAAYLAILCIFSADARAQGGPINEVLNRMDKRYQTLETLRADLKMDKLNAQLGVRDFQEGDLTLLPPKNGRKLYVRLNWAKPRVEHLAVINGDFYKLYVPAREQMIEGRIDSRKKDTRVASVLTFTTMSKEQMKANYSIKYLGQESLADGRRAARLELTPKAPASYKSVDLWVDSDGMPIQIRISEKNGDTVTLLLSNVVANQTVKGAVFDISPPKGTKIIKG